jgi:hypothetical protein
MIQWNFKLQHGMLNRLMKFSGFLSDQRNKSELILCKGQILDNSYRCITVS